METIYYRLNAARVTAGARKASGGECVRCVVLPRAARPAGTGKVISFDAYRRALEPAEDRAPEEVCPPTAGEAAPARRSGRRRGSRWAAADLCASVAVVACTAAAALGVLLT